MSDEPSDDPQGADRVLALAAELEASGDAHKGGSSLEKARAQLHEWIDSAAQIVTIPALGRVTIIHQNGSESSIKSSELAFAMSAPVARSQNS